MFTDLADSKCMNVDWLAIIDATEEVNSDSIPKFIDKFLVCLFFAKPSFY